MSEGDGGPLAGKVVVILGGVSSIVSRALDGEAQAYGFRISEALDDADIAIYGDDSDPAQVKAAQEKGLRVLDEIAWVDLTMEAFDVAEDSFDAEPGIESAAKGRVAAPSDGLLTIYMPCIEEDWEYGRLEFDEPVLEQMPAALQKAAQHGLDGWRVNFGKCTVGFQVDLSRGDSIERLLEALESGWTSWNVFYDRALSSFLPDDIEDPKSARTTYTEFRAMTGDEMYENLEDLGAITFLPGEQQGDEPERPGDSVLYSCSDLGEPAVKVTISRDGVVSAIYDASEQRLEDEQIKSTILNAIST